MRQLVVVLGKYYKTIFLDLVDTEIMNAFFVY